MEPTFTNTTNLHMLVAKLPRSMSAYHAESAFRISPHGIMLRSNIFGRIGP